MAQNLRAPRLETRAARLKLPISSKPVWVKIGVGVGLGYRRNTTAGSWVVRVPDGKGKGNYKTKMIGTADDHTEADGQGVLTFWQAQTVARDRASALLDCETSKVVAAERPAPDPTVDEALDRYEANLKKRRGDTGNVTRLRYHLTPALAATRVGELTELGLSDWHDGLAEKLAPATVNRTATCLKAALNLAASLDPRLRQNSSAWKIPLAAIPDAEESRNVILADDTVCHLVIEAPATGPAFALLVEVAALTGARYSQICRLVVGDLQTGDEPRLMMPASRKGKGTKKVSHRPVPISKDLANRLSAAAAGRLSSEPLLLKASGSRWRKSDHSRPFRHLARRCQLDPAEVTIYALRHSSIVRQLIRGVPTRVVAVNHDTSVVEIESTYSRYITDHTDAVSRAGLLDIAAAPATGNVVPLAARTK